MYSRVASYGVMKSPPEVPSPKALFSTLAFHIHQDSPKARLCWSLQEASLGPGPAPAGLTWALCPALGVTRTPLPECGKTWGQEGTGLCVESRQASPSCPQKPGCRVGWLGTQRPRPPPSPGPLLCLYFPVHCQWVFLKDSTPQPRDLREWPSTHTW